MKNLLLFVLVLFIPATLISQDVRINEVFYSTSNDSIELKNFDSQAVDITGWRFCAGFVYNPPINSLTIVGGGSLTIPAGGILVLTGFNLSDTASDLGLYLPVNSTADFGSADFMIDFVQWGSANNGREGVAVGKGIWTDDEFLATAASGSSIEYSGMGNGASTWAETTTPTLGAENSNVTSVENPAGIPEAFSLDQNFPNPFNPSTVIHYTIPQSANLINTRLEIFNLLGQKVRALVNTKQPSGTYTVTWNGTNDSGELLATGLYIYRLQAAEFADVKKMLFMK